MPGKAREIVAEWHSDYRRVAECLDSGWPCAVTAPDLTRAKFWHGERRACCVRQANFLEGLWGRQLTP